MTALILQARLDSTRLGGKALLPLGDKPMIFRVMEALAFSPCEKKILACPEDCVSAFAPLAEEAGFILVPGPKEDVLARYCLAIRRSGADRVIRATGDNPFVFIDTIGAIESEAEALGADFAGYFGMPVGAGVEALAPEALLRAEREAQAPDEREHVSPYLFRHPELFRLHRPFAPRRWQGQEYRITVDTREDYDRARSLYERLSSLPLKERNLGENVISAYESLWKGE